MKKMIIFFLLFSLKVACQGFHQGTINYLNGDTKKGLVEITSDVLKFKDNDDAKTIKMARIESKELEKIEVEFVIDSYNKFKKKKS